MQWQEGDVEKRGGVSLLDRRSGDFEASIILLRYTVYLQVCIRILTDCCAFFVVAVSFLVGENSTREGKGGLAVVSYLSLANFLWE